MVKYKAAIDKSGYDALESDDVKAFYAQDEHGIYVFQLEPGTVGDAVYGVEDVGTLKTTIATLRVSEKKLKQFGDLSPQDAKANAKKVEDYAKVDPSKEADAKAQARIDQLTTKHEGELAEKDAVISKKDKALTRAVVTDAATRALSEQKASVPLLLPTVEAMLFTEEDDNGDVHARVRDPKNPGIARITKKQGSQDPMTVAEFVETLRESKDFSPAFPGKEASGGGSEDANNSGGKSETEFANPTAALEHAFNAGK